MWQNTSIRNKLYILVGVMGLLIAAELATLGFAMNTLSAVRAFVHGEGLWSKAQKDAVLSLKEYAQTRDPEDYLRFLEYIKVPLGDRQARLELSKKDFNMDVVRHGFEIGRIHRDDVDGLVKLVKRFGTVNYLYKALAVWQQADEMVDDLLKGGADLHLAVRQGDPKVVQAGLRRINDLNSRLTILEDQFSATLGEGSRWLEQVLLWSLLLAVLAVESTGLLLTMSFAKQLSGGLRELNQITGKIRDGDFTQKAQVRSADELGQLAHAINKMSQALATSLSEQRRAEVASQTKSQFLANMSHEIRTPVGAIVGFIDLLKDPNLAPAEQQNYIEVIRRTGITLTKIIDDILDLSKVEAGYFDIEKSTFSLPKLLQDIEAIIQRKCKGKPIELIVRRVGEVPEFISTDSLRLRQILLNIMGNAAKFTEKGRIVLSYRLSGKNIIFDVLDHGMGIAPDQISLLFQPFSQVDSSSTRRHDGTGLGLVLSRRLAHLLGGNVELVRSYIGEGSLFRIKIAYEAAVEQTRPVSLPGANVFEASRFLKDKRVLIVDDNEDNRFLLNRILSKQGLLVSEANNGLEGVQKALSEEFDAIILDIQMPIMDGYTAAKKIRANGKSIPIIALTAHAMKEDRTKCLKAGCNAYLTKPIQVDVLLSTLVSQIQSPNQNSSDLGPRMVSL